MPTTTRAVKEFIRHKYAWPGGYPLFAICSDGEALCHDCVAGEYRQIIRATRNVHDRSGWRIVAVDINYEDGALYCAHCNTRIESAYAEPTV
jgi:hypothetical protein